MARTSLPQYECDSILFTENVRGLLTDKEILGLMLLNSCGYWEHMGDEFAADNEDCVRLGDPVISRYWVRNQWIVVTGYPAHAVTELMTLPEFHEAKTPLFVEMSQ